jgi:branched-subunit amino acid aminotransferase/4-amino-4-deoxychorismate lyase
MEEPATNAALYGKGVFTTVAVHGGEPWLWDKHWRRLVRDAGAVGVDLAGHTERSVRQALLQTGIVDGRARITFSDESQPELWGGRGDRKTGLSIITGEARPVPEPLRLTISPYSVNANSPLAGIKSCNYLENILAKQEASARGFHEAVRLNERAQITSACMANLFWLKDGTLFTPSLSTGCLPGTTREVVLDNLDYREGDFEISDLADANAVFLTSAGIGIVAAAEFDGRQLSPMAHPILELWPK